MILTADEVARSLSGSLKLLNRNAEGLGDFEVSYEAFWRSFAAIVLTAPAFVVALAGDRARLGLDPHEGLFANGWLVSYELLALALGWVAFPLAMIFVARALSLGRRYTRFIIAYNWSAVLASTIFAVPSAMLLIGAATPGLSVLFAVAFGVIVAQYRWFLAKAALGVSSGLASALVMIDFGLNYVVATAMSNLL